MQTVELVLGGSGRRACAPVCVVDDRVVGDGLTNVPPGQVGLRQFDGPASGEIPTEIRLHLVDNASAGSAGSWSSLRSLPADAVDVPRPRG